MNNPLVSIVIICFNGSRYLPTCFDSLLKQSYKNLEVIIVNDGSTDNSLDIMNDYVQKFRDNSMSLVICNQENGGMSAALNTGLKSVTGEYFMWCDCDDYYEPDAVENLLNYLIDNPQIDVVKGKCRLIDYNTKRIIDVRGPKDFLNSNVFESIIFETDSYCNTGVNMTSTKFLDKCIKDREIYINRAGQNWQLLVPFSYYGNFGFLDKVVYNYNIIESSDSNKRINLMKQLQRCNNHKKILFNTIDRIELMENYDKKNYKVKLSYKYKKKKLKIIRNNLLNSNKQLLAYQVCPKNKCICCGVCKLICPQDAVSFKYDITGFKYPIIDMEKCNNCGLCQKKCPVLSSNSNKKELLAYACYNNNEAERSNSSSGGIFILLAKEIIKRSGIVFGACFDKDFKVIHDCAESFDELNKFMTSKYVQSELNDSYLKAKKFLDDGKLVYFSGTPCQIEGLLSFLGKKYDNLLTQDIICHGVPSPKVWEKYKEYRLLIDKESPLEINFRAKDNGWKAFNISMRYSNTFYKKNHNDDLFMKAFLKNACLRESCFNCFFKKKYRNSDITLGDFWRIEEVFPNMNDDKGVSAVIINSNNGKELFDDIKELISYKNVDIELIIKRNSAMTNSVKKDVGRKKFFKYIDEDRFDKAVKCIGKENWIKKILRKVI